MEEKTIGYTLPVYVLTKTGSGLTDEGVAIVRNMILGEEDDPHIDNPGWKEKARAGLPENTTGVLIHSGVDLLDPANLAKLLESDLNSRVVMSYGDHFATLQYGRGENGLQPIIRNLKKAAETGIDSWTLIENSVHSE